MEPADAKMMEPEGIETTGPVDVAVVTSGDAVVTVMVTLVVVMTTTVVEMAQACNSRRA